MKRRYLRMDMEANGSPDSEIHHLEEQHRHYSEQLEALLQKPYPSEQEQLEEVRLKKLKLYVKDQLVARRSNHQSAYVA
ncbi:MAG: YdcH family protein [Silvibacterium sp.]|nr:YdcH family protein [Silvibacterium sp.]